MNKQGEEIKFEEELRKMVSRLCPYLSAEEQREEERRFKEFLDILWEIIEEEKENFDT